MTSIPSASAAAVNQYNTNMASANPPTLMEKVFEGIKKPVLHVWHKGDNHPFLRIALLVTAIGIPALLIFLKIQPLVEKLEHHLVPEYSMSWLGGFRMAIAAHELIEYITGT